MARQLNGGDLFPTYRVSTTEGRSLIIPADLHGKYAVLFFTVAFGNPTALGS